MNRSTPEISIRRAGSDDLERVGEIKVRSWAETYAALVEPDVLAPFLDREKQVGSLRETMASPATELLLAEDASATVIGFALIYLDEQPDPWLESIHVQSEFRDRGIGSLLMRAVASAVRSHGRRTLRLGVVSGNAGAARLYERLGGTLTGIEPASWADGVSHEVYRWRDVSVIGLLDDPGPPENAWRR